MSRARATALLVVLFTFTGLAGAHSGRVGAAHAAFTDQATATPNAAFAAATVPPMGTLSCGGTVLNSRLVWTGVTGATGYQITLPGGSTTTVGAVTQYVTGTISAAATYSVRAMIGNWTGAPASLTLLVDLGALACA